MVVKGGYTYILTNKIKTVLYIGVTSNLYTRIYDHKYDYGSTFTKKYNCKFLVYFEFFPTIEEAIAREKRLKKYPRKWKDNLINEMNPDWIDLFDQVKDMQ